MSISIDIQTVPQLNQTGHFTNGILAGLTAVSVMQPFYTIQTYASLGKGLPPVHALFRGFIANALCDVTSQGITFFSYGALTKQYSQEKPSATKECLVGLRRGNFFGTCDRGLGESDDSAAA